MPALNRPAVILIVITVFLAGCEGESGPEGPAGPALTGTLNGSVTLFLENGTQETDHDSVSVWIEGGTDTSRTDSLGRWRLPASTGIHTIRIEKAGYGYAQIPQVQFVGGGDLQLGVRTLTREPTFGVTGLVFIYSNPTQSLRVAGSISPTAPSDRSVLIFIGRQAIERNDPRTYIDTLVAAVYANSNVFNSPLFPLRDPPYNFATGDTIHGLVVPRSVTFGGYIDPISERTVFTTGIADTSHIWKYISP